MESGPFASTDIELKRWKPVDEIIRRIKLVEAADTDNFVNLVKLAGLDPTSDFRDFDLSGVSFENCDLRGLIFVGATFRGVYLTGLKYPASESIVRRFFYLSYQRLLTTKNLFKVCAMLISAQSQASSTCTTRRLSCSLEIFRDG